MLTKVLEILQHAGYRIIPPPLKIVDIDFQSDFQAVLIGPRNQQSMVVVLDASRTPIEVAKRRINALATTLDRSGSEIPLTLVLLMSDSESQKAAELDTICRVVRVLDPTDPENDLRPLLPLALPEPAEPLPSALPVLLRNLGAQNDDRFEASLAETAKRGPSAVTEAVRATIDKVVRQYLEGEGKK